MLLHLINCRFIIIFWPASTNPCGTKVKKEQITGRNRLAGCERVLKRDRIPLIDVGNVRNFDVCTSPTEADSLRLNGGEKYTATASATNCFCMASTSLPWLCIDRRANDVTHTGQSAGHAAGNAPRLHRPLAHVATAATGDTYFNQSTCSLSYRQPSRPAFSVRSPLFRRRRFA